MVLSFVWHLILNLSKDLDNLNLSFTSYGIHLTTSNLGNISLSNKDVRLTTLTTISLVDMRVVENYGIQEVLHLETGLEDLSTPTKMNADGVRFYLVCSYSGVVHFALSSFA